MSSTRPTTIGSTESPARMNCSSFM
jgi:hypothetical protein